jgi:hypothetical protein
MVGLLSLPEREAARLIRDMERDPLVIRLMDPSEGPPVLSRRRRAGASLSGRFYEINEAVLAGAPSMDVESLVEKRREAAALIKSMGAEAFERHFLYQEEPLSRDALAGRLGLTPAQVDTVFDFLLDFSAEAEFSPASAQAPSERPLCVGRVEGDSFEGFRVAYALPHLARGRYRVDRDSWEDRRRSLSPADRRRAADLLRRVEALNMRADTFHRVVCEALEAGREYLAGGGRQGLRALSLRETARRLSLASSTVCRVVAGRSVQLPWGEEVLLADLFPQKKLVLREALMDSAEWVAGRSDREVREWLLERHRLPVPRRTVNYWRRKLGLGGKA